MLLMTREQGLKKHEFNPNRFNLFKLGKKLNRFSFESFIELFQSADLGRLK